MSTPPAKGGVADAPANPPAPPGWSFYPGFSAGLGYDSNVFATPDNPSSDMVATYTPFLVVRHAGEGTSFSLSAEGTAARYRTHTQENSNDYRLDANGSMRAGSSGSVFGGAGISRAHEDRTSPDDVFGVSPTVYTDTHAHAGIAERWDSFSVRTGVTYNHLRFRNVASASGGIIDNGDRNREVIGIGARLGYAITQRTDLFVQGTFDQRSYDRAVDDYGFRRDSHGGGWAVGLARRGPGNVQGEIYVGRRMQRYDDPALADVSVPAWGARLNWTGADMTRLSVFLERTVEETTLPGASSLVDTAVGLRADRQVSGRLSTHAAFTFTRSNFQGIVRRDDIADTGVGLTYRLTRQLALDADYRLLQRHSDERSANYFRHEIYLGLRLDRGPAWWQEAAEKTGATGESSGPRGFYLGLAPGYDLLSTTVSSTRGTHGTDGGQFAQGGPSATAFAGFGWTFGRLYAALEADAAHSRASWKHVKSPTSRIYSAELTSDKGLTLDLGYVLPSSGVLSASVGRRRAHLASEYSLLGDVMYPQDNVRMGTLYGVGLEVPLSRHLFVRSRYDVTRYGNYDVVYDGGVDGFDTSVARYQLGLGWRLGASAPVDPEPGERAGGFYAGAQGGDDRSMARLDATHRQSNAPTVTAFRADFGARGEDFGAFAGYGHAFGPLYTGLELETDASRSLWTHTKNPGGRDFSVESRGSYGASLRLGVAVPGGALLYLRAGRVRSHFYTSYIKGGNANAWVERDDTRAGTRFGIGMEAPLTRSLFVRLDYTTTRYAAIEFTTTQANADDVRFAPRQQLVRLGIGMRFGGSTRG